MELEFLARGLLIALMMEEANTSETSVNFYQNTLRNIPEDSHLRSNSKFSVANNMDEDLWRDPTNPGMRL
jgi:hypothetical protein